MTTEAAALIDTGRSLFDPIMQQSASGHATQRMPAGCADYLTRGTEPMEKRRGRPFVDYWPTDAEIEAMNRALAAGVAGIQAAIEAIVPALAEAGRKLSQIQAAAVAHDPVFALTQRPEWRDANAAQDRHSRGSTGDAADQPDRR